MAGTGLSTEQRTQFVRDGFLAVRGLISVDEIVQIRETFMQAAANGPVAGLSDVPKVRDGAPANSSDPLASSPA